MAGGQACKARYKTKEDMQERVDEYFDKCDEKDKPYTVTGLALSIGLSRKQLISYSEKDEFCNTIRHAKQRCEQFAEDYLFSGKATGGAIFSLKNNWGWRDQLDVGPDSSQAKELKDLSDDELDNEIERLAGEV